MNTHGTHRRRIALTCALVASLAQAANYYWDGDTVTADGASGGASGAWAVGVGGWEDGSAAVNWANGNTAVLGGSGTFTNTLGGAVTAAGITVNGANYVVNGAQSLTAGALNIASGASLELANGTSALSLSGFAGAGTLTINKGASSTSLTALNAADALAATGTLRLRGGTTTTAPNTVGGHYLAFSGASLIQASGSAFALDTGTGTSNGKDLILGDGFNGKTLSLSSLTGYGAFRVDWGGTLGATVTRTINVNQTATTTFYGLILAHASTQNAVRSIKFEKDGAGQLTLAGIVGKQTASAGSLAAPVTIEVKGGTLVMTADNTTSGSLTVRTNAVLKMQNGSAGTGFTGGNSAMTNAYIVEAGGTLQGYRNGTAAFGTGSILLNGGKLAQEQGNWTWANAIVLGSGLTSTLESQSSNTGTRALKIQGVVSGDGDLTFSDTTGGMGTDTGFIFTGTNTLSGTVLIPANRKVRVGGVPGSSSDLGAGTGGTLGTATIVNNGALTFSRSDAHTFANTISGSGNVRVGSTGITGSGTQVLTLTGANTYAGGTGVNTGTLLVNGSHTGGSLYDVGANATLGGTGTVSVAGGGTVNLLANAKLAAGPAADEGGSFTLNTLTLAADAQIALDATNDLVIVNGPLTLNDNPVRVLNTAAYPRTGQYPFLTCTGAVTGTLPTRAVEERWFIRRTGNTFSLYYNSGTMIRVL